MPLLDPEFIEAYWNIPAEMRMPQYKGIEKWWLRKAFDGTDLLPNEVLYRTKEAFSDGVSSKEKSWYVIIQEQLEDKYEEKDFDNEEMKYHLKPVSKEALHYRKLFNNNFGYDLAHVIPYYWLPKWCGNITEPSARVLEIYKE